MRHSEFSSRTLSEEASNKADNRTDDDYQITKKYLTVLLELGCAKKKAHLHSLLRLTRSCVESDNKYSNDAVNLP